MITTLPEPAPRLTVATVGPGPCTCGSGQARAYSLAWGSLALLVGLPPGLARRWPVQTVGFCPDCERLWSLGEAPRVALLAGPRALPESSAGERAAEPPAPAPRPAAPEPTPLPSAEPTPSAA
jgi:hypothetical protein